MKSSLQAQAQAAFCPEAVPHRVIFLLDFDSYFARCMQQAYPPLRNRPVGIRGPARGTMLIAASPEAKKRGIKTGTFVSDALRLCPDIILVGPDMDMYVELCTRALKVLTSFTDKVEPFSIDESFMDVTEIVEKFGDVHMLAQAIKRALREALGETVTTSIGIGPNKMIAKLVSHFHKPDGITHVTAEQVPELLPQIALLDICGIGSRVAKRLAKLGIYTVSQLGRFPRAGLVREFGVLGHLYWLWGQGIDLSPVSPYHGQAAEKSMGHSMTLPVSATRREEVDSVLLRLCERVGRRLRRGGYRGRVFHCWVAYAGELGPEEERGRGGRYRLPEASDDSQVFYQVAQSFLPVGQLPHPVIQLHVSVSELGKHPMQLSLTEDLVSKNSLQRALDTINDRYGELTISRAALLGSAQRTPIGDPQNGLRKRYAI